MATAAFIVPLIGVHNNIASVKRTELDRLRDEIRVERAVVIDKLSDENPASPRLANLTAYYQLIDGAREWPIDAANLLRFFLYLVIGLGSWLGVARSWNDCWTEHSAGELPLCGEPLQVVVTKLPEFAIHQLTAVD